MTELLFAGRRVWAAWVITRWCPLGKCEKQIRVIQLSIYIAVFRSRSRAKYDHFASWYCFFGINITHLSTVFLYCMFGVIDIQYNGQHLLCRTKFTSYLYCWWMLSSLAVVSCYNWMICRLQLKKLGTGNRGDRLGLDGLYAMLFCSGTGYIPTNYIQLCSGLQQYEWVYHRFCCIYTGKKTKLLVFNL